MKNYVITIARGLAAAEKILEPGWEKNWGSPVMSARF